VIEFLVETLLDMLGVTGVFSDRHRAWIMRLFVGLLLALGGGIAFVIVMVATGRL
jgi:zinc transporter ZupT